MEIIFKDMEIDGYGTMIEELKVTPDGDFFLSCYNEGRDSTSTTHPLIYPVEHNKLSLELFIEDRCKPYSLIIHKINNIIEWYKNNETKVSVDNKSRIDSLLMKYSIEYGVDISELSVGKMCQRIYDSCQNEKDGVGNGRND